MNNAAGRLLTMGDCGAFSYVRDDEPPYTVDDLIDFYDGCGFDLGVSLDHVILGYLGAAADRRGAEPPPQEWKRRQDLTLQLAVEFKRRHREALSLHASRCGSGLEPGSFANAVKTLQGSATNRIALGGMVPLRTGEILACLAGCRRRQAIPRPNSICWV